MSEHTHSSENSHVDQEINENQENGLHRVLNERHVTMLAIGGAIGSGLFLNSGQLISKMGPIGALCSYMTCGVLVYFLMHSLGELAAKFPSAGSFSFYGRRFVDPGFGFAIGWNYWINWAITVALDVLGACILFQYWCPNLSRMTSSLLFFSIILALNLISVKGFSEAEYGAAFLKVFTILVFLAVGMGLIGYDVGVRYGAKETFKYWAWNSGGYLSKIGLFARMLITSAFSFQGSELIGITAGESKDPERVLPIAVRQVFFRILFFYVLSTCIIGTLISPDDPVLLKEDVVISPFTLIFERIIGPFAAHLMNLIVLSAVLSSANSGLYASARTLYGLAIQNMAPTCFTRLTRQGIPLNAILATSAVSIFCFFLAFFEFWNFYSILVAASSIAGFLAWMGIALAHYRFRRGWLAQKRSLRDLPFVAKFFPVGPICVILLSLCVIVSEIVNSVFTEPNVCDLMIKGMALFLFIGMWLGYRWMKKSKIVSYESMDFSKEIF